MMLKWPTTSGDVRRLHSLMNQARTIGIWGCAPRVGQHHTKLSTDIANCDLILCNGIPATVVVELLGSINHQCTILIGEYTEPSFVSQISAFLDKNAHRYQSSRRMLIDGVREHSLMLIHSSPFVRLPYVDGMTVFLVLKTGGPIYDYNYVNATANNIRRHLTGNYELVCITDDSKGITAVDRVVKMRHEWPKWWGKIELFREDITTSAHCIFVDLDTVCLSNIDFLRSPVTGLAGLRDFYNLEMFQTGIMRWDTSAEIHKIYETFCHADISKYAAVGDHTWVGAAINTKQYIQDMFPGKICSYKRHRSKIADGTMSPSIVCFHGDPRPHAVTDRFITDQWRINLAK